MQDLPTGSGEPKSTLKRFHDDVIHVGNDMRYAYVGNDMRYAYVGNGVRYAYVGNVHNLESTS